MREETAGDDGGNTGDSPEHGDDTTRDPEYDVKTGQTLWEKLVGGAADQPVLAVFVVILLLMALGFLVTGVLVVSELLVG